MALVLSKCVYSNIWYIAKHWEKWKYAVRHGLCRQMFCRRTLKTGISIVTLALVLQGEDWLIFIKSLSIYLTYIQRLDCRVAIIILTAVCVHPLISLIYCCHQGYCVFHILSNRNINLSFLSTRVGLLYLLKTANLCSLFIHKWSNQFRGFEATMPKNCCFPISVSYDQQNKDTYTVGWTCDQSGDGSLVHFVFCCLKSQETVKLYMQSVQSLCIMSFNTSCMYYKLYHILSYQDIAAIDKLKLYIINLYALLNWCSLRLT